MGIHDIQTEFFLRQRDVMHMAPTQDNLNGVKFFPDKEVDKDGKKVSIV